MPLAGRPLSSAISPQGATIVPQLSIQGISGGGEEINLTPLATDNNAYQGSITQIIGNHTVKFGLGWVSTGFKSTINYTQPALTIRKRLLPNFPVWRQATACHPSCLTFPSPHTPQRRRTGEAWRRLKRLPAGFLEGNPQTELELWFALRLHFYTGVRDQCDHRQEWRA